MSFKPVAAAALLSLVASLPAAASVVTIDFETPTSFASIDTHYAGGTDGAGVAGANLGVSFGGSMQALRNDVLGTYFSNAPSPIGVMFAADDSEAFMNVAGGFIGISLSYSADRALASMLEFWSGLDGTGTLLAIVSLTTGNATDGGCTGGNYCNFETYSTVFAQRVYSVSFAGAVNAAVFDDVRLDVPEPATALLVGLGLIGAAVSRRRS